MDMHFDEDHLDMCPHGSGWTSEMLVRMKGTWMIRVICCELFYRGKKDVVDSRSYY